MDINLLLKKLSLKSSHENRMRLQLLVLYTQPTQISEIFNFCTLKEVFLIIMKCNFSINIYH